MWQVLIVIRDCAFLCQLCMFMVFCFIVLSADVKFMVYAQHVFAVYMYICQYCANYPEMFQYS